MKDQACRECGTIPAPVLFVQDLCPVQSFFTRAVVIPAHRIEYRLCRDCQQRHRQYDAIYLDNAYSRLLEVA